MDILPQITQITQRNTASCIITQRKTGCLRLRLFCCFGVCLRKSARSAGDIGVRLCKSRRDIEDKLVIHGVLLCVILPQITLITQTNTAWLYYFAEKDRLLEVKAVLGFWGLSAIICEICGRLNRGYIFSDFRHYNSLNSSIIWRI